MVFGKTHRQRKQDYQDFLKNVKDKGIKKFAFFPIELTDGRKIWLQYYYQFYGVYEAYGILDVYSNYDGAPLTYNYLTQNREN